MDIVPIPELKRLLLTVRICSTTTSARRPAHWICSRHRMIRGGMIERGAGAARSNEVSGCRHRDGVVPSVPRIQTRKNVFTETG